MQKNCLSYHETMRKYFADMPERNFKFIKQWERRYLEEGIDGLMKERRGKSTKQDNPKKGRPPKLEKTTDEDLITENQRLKMENEYLKKLNALVQERIQRESGKRR